jgi:hypothetical protein
MINIFLKRTCRGWRKRLTAMVKIKIKSSG